MELPLSSLATRSEASDWKTTVRLSPKISGAEDPLFPEPPPVNSLTKPHRVGVAVVDEDVAAAVGVAGDQVAGIAVERHEPAVVREVHLVGIGIAQHAGIGLADDVQFAGHQILDEGLAEAWGIPERGCLADEATKRPLPEMKLA